MFFKNKKKKDEIDDLTKVAALLIHAAKIDQDYSVQEDDIIKKTMIKIGINKEKIEKLMIDAKKIENDSNQILDFTKKVKNMSEDNKIKIVETLWKIIYSNNEADIYETNLMRRLGGLLYIDSNVMGNIKNKIKKENS